MTKFSNQAEGPYQKRYKTKITSRVYETLREEYAEYISKKNKRRKQPPEEKARQIAAMTGRKRSEFSKEWKENLSKNHKSKQPRFVGALSEETRKKMSEKAKGRKQSEETIVKNLLPYEEVNEKNPLPSLRSTNIC